MVRDIRQASGLFFALLAILAQVTLASAVPATAMALADTTMLCHHDGDRNPPSAPAHPSPDCLFCFVCNGAAGSPGLLATPAVPPPPRSAPFARIAVAASAAQPPPRIVLAARPRGPPILV